jgi:hypothetical protein
MMMKNDVFPKLKPEPAVTTTMGIGAYGVCFLILREV